MTSPRGDQVEVHLKGKEAGTVIIKCTANFSGSVYVDEVEVEILEELRFINLPTFQHRPLLMTQNSELNLKTNRDASAEISYTVQPVEGFACLAVGSKCSESKSPVSVDNNGIVRTSDLIGQALILVSVRETFGIIQIISLPIEVNYKSISILILHK